jgi:hypothetical protein
MREWVVLAETDPLDGLTHSMVEYVNESEARRMKQKYTGHIALRQKLTITIENLAALSLILRSRGVCDG